ncbi:MAG: NAD(P)H-hydrate dehydratase [Micavibrio sp. TMED27]|nr:MAG: NAD(P)H-hydrate dehydratase [Micavibrio sp. TMED27]
MCIQINTPDLWLSNYPRITEQDHKYTRGHAVIFGAPELTGATRLASEAAARIGAGLVSVLCTKDTADIYKASLPAHILVRNDLNWWDERITAQLYGSGGLATSIEIKNKPTVLDADALGALPKNLNEHCILTPHEGEFSKTFPNISGKNEERALIAAQDSGAIIILKGPQTIIAHPDGRLCRNEHASASLATAGTGDVLAGLITGLLAQKMDPYAAACAAVWIHGDAAIKFGHGLVASDISEQIPRIISELRES